MHNTVLCDVMDPKAKQRDIIAFPRVRFACDCVPRRVGSQQPGGGVEAREERQRVFFVCVVLLVVCCVSSRSVHAFKSNYVVE